MSGRQLPAPPPSLAESWPELAWAFARIPPIAWGVAAGFASRDSALNAIRCESSVRVAFRNRHPGSRYEFSALWVGLAWALSDAVEKARRDRTEAQEAVQKEIAPLLDRRAPFNDVLAAATRANADGLLTSAEIQNIVDLEQTWWVRLHAALVLKEARIARQ